MGTDEGKKGEGGQGLSKQTKTHKPTHTDITSIIKQTTHHINKSPYLSHLMSQRPLKYVVGLLLLFALSVGTITAQHHSKRPRIGLVLGGGGAKGAAHVGVLRVLQNLNVPIHCVVGTSIGSIIGGLYAAGVPVNTLDSLFREQDWARLFALEVVKRDAIEELFRSLLPDNVPEDFDKLPKPFRCVAVDLHTMHEVVFSEGDLAQAMRASMAIPGVLRSVKTDSMKLVDGGVLNNLPVDIARQMGADIVIAVDLQQNQHKEDKVQEDYKWNPKSTKAPHIDWLLKRPDWDIYQRNKHNADILIHPNLKGYGVASFAKKHIEAMIEIGYNTAMKQKRKLKKLRR